MGCALSYFSSAAAVAADDGRDSITTIMVVAGDGSLQEFTARVTAAEAAASGACRGTAVCDSDKIFFDAFPPAMLPEAELEAGQIYFLFEAAELRRRVTGADMAALAMKASVALRRAAEKQGRRDWKPRVMPMADLGSGGGGDGMVWDYVAKNKESGLTLKRRVGGLRVLSTVYEGSEE